ncbi:hypothetical protein [Paracoccus spongiarum]|uniref:Uncharacterized protein n=1 Tax=Paracoccus spongiarum TaxID=3064387 RepID=A0ABT9JGM5_9RHOB|nr:hypothetical protein [Paracoccus sp. 2205BS29-5]MDP5308976.1 hypothetical protein [Paracoccus sp. 2205BS29-5]
MTASVTRGRALRYAGGSARGLLHHHPGHCPERIMAIILEEWRTGAPPASFLDATSDAEFWARTACFDDLRAVFLAAGRKLARYRLGTRGRIRMVRRLLQDLDGDEQRRILEELSGR